MKKNTKVRLQSKQVRKGGGTRAEGKGGRQECETHSSGENTGSRLQSKQVRKGEGTPAEEKGERQEGKMHSSGEKYQEQSAK